MYNLLIKLVRIIRRKIQEKQRLEDFLKAHVIDGPKLNLGCGFDYREGWDNWDFSKNVKADIYLDITKDTFPVPDEYYSEIYCNGVLEQILENDKFLHCMNECQRILKKGGVLLIVAPNAKFSISFKDPHDCRHLIPETFHYFCANTRAYQRYGKIYGYLPWTTFVSETNKRGLMTIALLR